MTEPLPWLLEIRLFTLHPGTRTEFDRISREGTVPLMRRQGITVLAHSPAQNDEDGYVLIRAFPSEEDRVRLSQSLYTLPEWERDFDDQVTSMILDYRTAVLPMSLEAIGRLAAGADAGC